MIDHIEKQPLFLSLPFFFLFHRCCAVFSGVGICGITSVFPKEKLFFKPHFFFFVGAVLCFLGLALGGLLLDSPRVKAPEVYVYMYICIYILYRYMYTCMCSGVIDYSEI